MRPLSILVNSLLLGVGWSICPLGTIRGPGRRTCYQTYVSKQLSWSDSEDYCRLNNGHLVTIPDAEVDNLLAAILGNGTYWIGGRRTLPVIPSNRWTGWTWADGSTWTNTNWAC
ncbi:polycystin-1, partial [Aphelenchoides avenae]